MLELLPGWAWDPFEDQWNTGYEYLEKYIDEHGNAKVPNGFKYGDFKLGRWVNTQRQDKDNLSLEKITKLESLPGWIWKPFEKQWNEGFEYLTKYVEEYGHARVQIGFKYGDFNLGKWVSTQRRGRNDLSSERIEKLESLPGWVWRVKSD